MIDQTFVLTICRHEIYPARANKTFLSPVWAARFSRECDDEKTSCKKKRKKSTRNFPDPRIAKLETCQYERGVGKGKQAFCHSPTALGVYYSCCFFSFFSLAKGMGKSRFMVYNYWGSLTRSEWERERERERKKTRSFLGEGETRKIRICSHTPRCIS